MLSALLIAVLAGVIVAVLVRRADAMAATDCDCLGRATDEVVDFGRGLFPNRTDV